MIIIADQIFLDSKIHVLLLLLLFVMLYSSFVMNTLKKIHGAIIVNNVFKLLKYGVIYLQYIYIFFCDYIKQSFFKTLKKKIRNCIYLACAMRCFKDSTKHNLMSNGELWACRFPRVNMHDYPKIRNCKCGHLKSKHRRMVLYWNLQNV